MWLSSTLFALAATLGLVILASSGHPIHTPKASPLKIAVVAPDRSDYWLAVRKGAEKAAKETGANVNFRFAEHGVIETPQIVDDLLSKGAEGIIISNSAYQPDLINSAANKTLIFTVGTDAPNSERTCYIGPDEVGAGYQVGAELKRVLPKGGDVVVFADFETKSPTRERIQGLKKSVQGSHIRILEVRPDFSDLIRAEKNVVQAMADYPSLAACVGIHNYNGQLALKVLQKTNRTGKIKIIGFDAQDDLLSGIRRGEVSALIVQQPFGFGYKSVVAMVKYLNGTESVIPNNQRILVPSLTIRRDNVEAFEKQLQQWHKAPIS